MKVQNQPTYTPRTLNQAPNPGGPEQPQPQKDKYAAYNEEDANKHRVSYETAYNVTRGLAYALEGGARVGQTMALGSSLLGLQAGSLAGGVGLVGGTIDVARGASRAQQAAINRDTKGALAGGLQVATGLATYTSIGAALAGAPPVVSQVAAGAALLALAGKVAVEQSAKHGPKKEINRDELPKPEVSVKLDEKAKPHGEGRTLEKTFAMAKAVNDAASNIGGMAAGWNNVHAVWSGTGPTGIWQPLGIVGSTYTVLQSAAMVAHAAGNQHLEDTVAGSIGLVQGGASLAISLGVGSRLLGGVAIGAFLLKSLLPMLQLKKRLSGNKEGEDGQQSMMDRVKENLTNAFNGEPADTEVREIRSPEKPGESKENQDDKKSEEPKKPDDGSKD